MVNISEITFVIIVQVIVMLLMLAVFLWFLLRSKNKKIKALQLAGREVKKEEGASPLASVEYYITAELKLAETRFDMLFKEEELLEPEFSEADWITLRKKFLEIEKSLLMSENRLDNFWLFLGDKLRKLLKETHLVKRINTKESREGDDDDVKEMKSLLKSQYDDFDSMYLELEGEKTDEEIKELKARLTKIIRNHTELSHCIHMLESENSFLRDQIQGLVAEDKVDES